MRAQPLFRNIQFAPRIVWEQLTFLDECNFGGVRLPDDREVQAYEAAFQQYLEACERLPSILEQRAEAEKKRQAELGLAEDEAEGELESPGRLPKRTNVVFADVPPLEENKGESRAAVAADSSEDDAIGARRSSRRVSERP